MHTHRRTMEEKMVVFTFEERESMYLANMEWQLVAGKRNRDRKARVQI